MKELQIYTIYKERALLCSTREITREITRQVQHMQFILVMNFLLVY